MRTLAVGDVHGCLAALDALLGVVNPGPDDYLVTLGDYVDRGPDSRGVLDRLAALFDAGRLVALRGNHDQMMVEARDDARERRVWLACGGKETLRSYGHGPHDETYDRVPERHWQFLERDCRPWYETDTHIYVHASLYPDLPMAEQPAYMLLWEKLAGPVAHESGKVVVCGHTRQAGPPLDLGSTVCIDTGAYDRDGWLTCLHAEAGRYWQANQRGQTRAGWLGG
jgi:serine/threonine protein phosphatase 1